MNLQTISSEINTYSMLTALPLFDSFFLCGYSLIAVWKHVLYKAFGCSSIPLKHSNCLNTKISSFVIFGQKYHLCSGFYLRLAWLVSSSKGANPQSAVGTTSSMLTEFGSHTAKGMCKQGCFIFIGRQKLMTMNPLQVGSSYSFRNYAASSGPP